MMVRHETHKISKPGGVSRLGAPAFRSPVFKVKYPVMQFFSCRDGYKTQLLKPPLLAMVLPGGKLGLGLCSLCSATLGGSLRLDKAEFDSL